MPLVIFHLIFVLNTDNVLMDNKIKCRQSFTISYVNIYGTVKLYSRFFKKHAWNIMFSAVCPLWICSLINFFCGNRNIFCSVTGFKSEAITIQNSLKPLENIVSVEYILSNCIDVMCNNITSTSLLNSLQFT